MSRRKTRERQLAKLAARRAAERHKQRRRRVALATAFAVLAMTGVGVGLALALGGGSKPVAAPTSKPSPTPTPSASPGSNCGYVATEEPTLKSGPVAPPAFTIDVKKTYTATVKTTMGTIVIELLPKNAPCAVNSFVYLAGKQFYDGIIFHRIVKDFVDQAGDPQGTGAGGPGYKFNDELNSELKYREGTVAMANSGPNTNGSQFFIVVDGGGKRLPTSYTIFGKVIKGIDVAKKINAVPTIGSGNNPDLPKKKIKILTLRIKTS